MRRTLRLRGYDYSLPGMYFVTVCEHKRKCLFGDITGGGVMLSGIGRIVEKCWREIPVHFPHTMLDQYVIMPNHIHGIIFLNDYPLELQAPGNSEVLVGTRPSKEPISLVGTQHAVSPQGEQKKYSASFGRLKPGSLSTIMRSFKSAATKAIHEVGSRDFQWESRFYEHVVRDGDDLDRIREYVLENPANWKADEEYPHNIRGGRILAGNRTWSPLD